ncbi:hypothetical protein C0992_011368 [Termitomyces sp. T32_za158]|nr:hypothetical protein C0992_002479 [Termitomyces sp. T32_za158]KAG6876917.1 hypothetical protein C0992_011368 [Termitomyces sp. T32_za158]
MFYKEKIALVVENELSPGANNTERLLVIKRVTRDLWAAEENSVVERVHKRLAELRREREEKLENPPKLPSPEEICENLEGLPAFIGRFLEWAESITGWSFSCIMGGPDPMMGGEIRVGSYHVGQSPSGKQFKDSTEFNRVMESFTKFLYTVYPESVRQSRAANPGQLSNSPSLNKSEDNVDQNLENSLENTKSKTLSKHKTKHDIAEVQAKVAESSKEQSSPELESACSQGDQLAPGSLMNETGHASLPDNGINISTLFSAESSANPWPGIQGPDGHTANDYQPPCDNMLSEQGQYDFNLGFGFDAGLMPKPYETQSIALTPPFFNAGPLFNNTFVMPTGSVSMPLAPTHMDPPPMETSVSGAILASPTTPVGALLVPPGAILASPTMPVGGVLALPNVPAEATLAPPGAILASPTVPVRGVLALPNAPVNAPVGAIPAPPSVTPPSTPDPAPARDSPLATSNAGISHSRQTIIPSTRADQLNKIGSDAIGKTLTERENGPENGPGPIEQPKWMEAALAHFSSRDLGEGWKTCVNAWGVFEKSLDYHSGKVTCLFSIIIP